MSESKDRSKIAKAIVKLGSTWVELNTLVTTLEELGVPEDTTGKVRAAMRLIDDASDELEPFQ